MITMSSEKPSKLERITKAVAIGSIPMGIAVGAVGTCSTGDPKYIVIGAYVGAAVGLITSAIAVPSIFYRDPQ